jgi:4-hydroxybenzoate polyprenyltransferase
MTRVFTIIARTVGRIEQANIGFSGWLASFAAIVFLRNVLEGISQRRADLLTLDGAAFFLHSYGFYAAGTLGIILVLAWVTRERIEQVSKFVLAALPLILLPPLVDLAATGGAGAMMVYRSLPPPDSFFAWAVAFAEFVLWSPFGALFLGGTDGRGVLRHDLATNYGIRIEIPLLILVLLWYIFVKTRSAAKIAVAALALFVGLFAISVFPSVVASLAGVSVLELAVGEPSRLNPALSGGNAAMGAAFALVVIALAVAWLIHYDRKKAFVVLKNTRLFRVAVNILILAGGMYFGLRAAPPDGPLTAFDGLTLFLAVVAVVFHWIWAIVHNDIHDERGDRISEPQRPLPSGELTRADMRIVGNFAAGLSFVAALPVGMPFTVLLASRLFLTVLYSAPPFRLKAVPGISNLTLGAAYLFTMMAGYVAVGASLFSFPASFVLIVLVGYALGTEYKNLKDHAGDEADGVRTLPVLLGVERSKPIIGLLGVAAFLTVPLAYQQYFAELLPVALLAGFAFYSAVIRPRYEEWVVFLICFLFVGAVALFDILGIVHL